MQEQLTSLMNAPKLEPLFSFLKNESNLTALYASPYQHDDNWTVLHYAAHYGLSSVIDVLLTRSSVDPLAVSNYQDSPLHLAVRSGHFEASQCLMARSNLMHRNKSLKLPYFVAKDEKLKAKTKQDKQKYKDLMSLLGPATFVEACGIGDVTLAIKMIKEGVDVNSNHEGVTGLMRACMEQQINVVTSLLAFPTIKVNDCNSLGETALHYVCYTDLVNGEPTGSVYDVNQAELTIRQEIAKLLIARQADINAQDNHGNTPLAHAVVAKLLDIVKILIETKGINYHKKYGNDPKNQRSILQLAEGKRFEIWLFLKKELADKGLEDYETTRTSYTFLAQRPKATQHLTHQNDNVIVLN